MNHFYRVALAVSLCCSAALAHSSPVQVSSLTLKPAVLAKDLPADAAAWANGAIKMPFVSSESPAVAARINGALFVGLMGGLPPVRPSDSFSPAADQLPYGTASQEFRVTRNDGRVLVITISAEGCGAYCEYYDTDLNFDTRNGRALALEDLLAQSALATVARSIGKERQRRYAKQFKDLTKELAASKKAHAKADEIEDLIARIALNQRCLLDEKPMRDLRYVGFSLEGKGISLRIGRCSNHAERALDDVGELIVNLPTAQLGTLLTPYGLALVLDQGDAPAPASPFGQVLNGRIGGASVMLQLDRLTEDGSVSGRYCYVRHGRMIALSGRRQGNKLVLAEDLDGKKAELNLTIRGNSLVGQWQGQGRTVPVTLD